MKVLKLNLKNSRSKKPIVKVARNQVLPRTSKHNFTAAAAHVIGLVGSFGEDFCSRLTGGEIVSTDEDYAPFADVYVPDLKMAIQVKMCNQNHAQRPTVEQVRMLHEEARVSFVLQISRGMYALVFYSGVENYRSARHGKSKLLSRRLSRHAKRSVLAQELERVYLIDAKLMNELATHIEFADIRRSGKVKVCATRKLGFGLETSVLYLTRTFLRGFVDRVTDSRHVSALERVFGPKNWSVSHKQVELKFHLKGRTTLRRSLPVKIIGSRGRVVEMRKLLCRKQTISMQLDS